MTHLTTSSTPNDHPVSCAIRCRSQMLSAKLLSACQRRFSYCMMCVSRRSIPFRGSSLALKEKLRIPCSKTIFRQANCGSKSVTGNRHSRNHSTVSTLSTRFSCRSIVRVKCNCASNTSSLGSRSTRSTLCSVDFSRLQEFQHPSRHCF